MNRSLLPLISISFLLAACGDAEPRDVTGEELSDFVTYETDIDGNDIDDLEQSMVIGGSEEFGAVFFVESGPKLPGGTASGQKLNLVGFGGGEYSSVENNWADPFIGMSEVLLDGELAWYGVGGLRPGVYEVSCATESAELGTLDDWCLLGEDMAEGDEREFLITVTDGDETCPRQSVHAGFQVWEDYTVTALGYRISDPDPTCY